MDAQTQRNLAAVVAVIAVITLVAVVLYSQIRVHNVGKIKGIGVRIYWNAECTDEVTEINWGELRPGEMAGVNLYVKNVKNTNATLSYETEAWNPQDAGQYLTFDWNYTDGTVLEPGQVILVQFTLSVDPTIEGVEEFSFDIVITATEAS